MLVAPRFLAPGAVFPSGAGQRMTALRIGIDFGGTKIEAAALDDRGALHLRQRVPTPVGDYAGTIAAIAALVARIEQEIGPGASVGIAIPGTVVAATGLVKNANSVWLKAGRSAVTLKRRSAGQCASPMMPIVSCCRRPPTARRPDAARCSGSFSAPGSGAAS
jgi:hypothetical protein